MGKGIEQGQGRAIVYHDFLTVPPGYVRLASIGRVKNEWGEARLMYVSIINKSQSALCNCLRRGQWYLALVELAM